MKKTLLVLSSLAILFTACSKDDDPPADVTPTVATLTGSYKLGKITMIATGVPESDITTTWLEACERDDIYKLNGNMTYEIVDAGTVCSPSTAWTDTWALGSTTAITIDGADYTIRKFDGKNLELTQNLGGGTLVSYFVKQ